MRSSLHGTFATLLLLIPVGAIPALAIFGIPQFAPVVASPLHEGHEGDRERREGRSARGPADDLFQDEDDFASRGEGEFPTRGTDAGLGQLGDAVAVPVRHASRNTAPAQLVAGQHDSSERSVNGVGRVPNWADDLPVETRQGTSRHNNAKFERFADNTSAPNNVPSQHEPDPRAFTRSAADRGDAAPTHRAMSGEQGGGQVRPAGYESIAAGVPPSFQRQREMPFDQAAAAPALGSREADTPGALTWKTAVRQLNALEIRNFRIEPGRQPSQFIFICSYTPTDSPRVSYRFEAEADEPLKAVEKVLVQISEWQQRR